MAYASNHVDVRFFPKREWFTSPMLMVGFNGFDFSYTFRDVYSTS